MIQFDSIQFFISFHTEPYSFVPIVKLSTASINCAKCRVVFILVIHDIAFGNMHVLWK